MNNYRIQFLAKNWKGCHTITVSSLKDIDSCTNMRIESFSSDTLSFLEKAHGELILKPDDNLYSFSDVVTVNISRIYFPVI